MSRTAKRRFWDAIKIKLNQKAYNFLVELRILLYIGVVYETFQAYGYSAGNIATDWIHYRVQSNSSVPISGFVEVSDLRNEKNL